MATDLIMPTLVEQRGPFFVQDRPHFSHARSHSFQTVPQPQPFRNRTSPLSTPHDGSPTSPKSCLNESVRPVYVPAVLRPNKHHSKKPRATKAAEDLDGGDLLCLQRSNSSFISLPGFNILGQKLSRRSTGDSGKILDLELDADLFPQVTGEPTRKHWKPDTESVICDDPTCKRRFTPLNRRHHCRRCGNIFCHTHSNEVIPLDEDCNYNPRGTLARACFHCFTEFKVWKSRNGSRSGSDQSSDSSDTPSSPVVASPIVPMMPGMLPPTKGPEVAASVPRDWNWSTF